MWHGSYVEEMNDVALETSEVAGLHCLSSIFFFSSSRRRRFSICCTPSPPFQRMCVCFVFASRVPSSSDDFDKRRGPSNLALENWTLVALCALAMIYFIAYGCHLALCTCPPLRSVCSWCCCIIAYLS